MVFEGIVIKKSNDTNYMVNDEDERTIKVFETFPKENLPAKPKRVSFSYRDVSSIRKVECLKDGNIEYFDVETQFTEEDNENNYGVNSTILPGEKSTEAPCSKYMRVEFLYSINILIFIFLLFKTGYYFDFSCNWILLIFQLQLIRTKNIAIPNIIACLIPFAVLVPLICYLHFNLNIQAFITTLDPKIQISLILYSGFNMLFLLICIPIYRWLPLYRVLLLIFTVLCIFLGLITIFGPISVWEYYLIDALFIFVAVAFIFIGSKGHSDNYRFAYSFINQTYHLICWVVIFLLYKLLFLKRFTGRYN